jgi:methionyl-tRNA formyltransferase
MIYWDKDAMTIYNLVRAVTHPYPGAFTYMDGKKLFVWKAYPEDTVYEGVPGAVLSKRPFVVNTGRGGLQLLRVQYDGEEEFDGDVFAKKYDLENKTLGGNV